MKTVDELDDALRQDVTLDKRFLNPFDHLVETSHFKDARIVRSSFKQRLKDLWRVLFGRMFRNEKFSMHAGLLDYILPGGFLLAATARGFRALFDANPLAKFFGRAALVLFVLIPGLLFQLIKAVVAALVFIPGAIGCAIGHAIEQKEREKQATLMREALVKNGKSSESLSAIHLSLQNPDIEVKFAKQEIDKGTPGKLKLVLKDYSDDQRHPVNTVRKFAYSGRTHLAGSSSVQALIRLNMFNVTKNIEAKLCDLQKGISRINETPVAQQSEKQKNMLVAYRAQKDDLEKLLDFDSSMVVAPVPTPSARR